VAENILQDRSQDNGATAIWPAIQCVALIAILLDAGPDRKGWDKWVLLVT